MTLEDLKEQYRDYDPDILVDMLNISSDDLLDRFEDKLETILTDDEEE